MIDKDKDEELRKLPRWIKAFLAARVARRAVEILDARKLEQNFQGVLDTLKMVDDAIEKGSEIRWQKRGFSEARKYADSFSHEVRRTNAAHFAALAVDDAFGLVTQEGRFGRGRISATEYQIRKLKFAIGSARQASQRMHLGEKLVDSITDDFNRIVEAVSGIGIWSDDKPVPHDFLTNYCRFDIDAPIEGSSIVALRPIINDEIVYRLNENSKLLYQLEPREFEEIIAIVFEGFGFDVELTSPVRDGGRDIIAISHEPAKQKYLIECKKYAKKNKVGIAIVQRLHGLVSGEGATMGILATTSTFTEPAREFLQSPLVEYRLEGRDMDGIKAWLSEYEQRQRIQQMIGQNFTLTPNGLVIPIR